LHHLVAKEFGIQLIEAPIAISNLPGLGSGKITEQDRLSSEQAKIRQQQQLGHAVGFGCNINACSGIRLGRKTVFWVTEFSASLGKEKSGISGGGPKKREASNLF
jgi:hypothetical protein